MRIPRFFRILAPVVLPSVLFSSVFSSLLAPSAHAATVKGTVKLPDSVRSGRQHRGYWRLENGTLPIKAGSKQPGAVVVLDRISGTHAPPATTVTVEISNLEPKRRLVVIGPGSVVEFKNVGRTTHELSTPADTSVMPVQRLDPGKVRHQKFSAPGGYLVRCNEYPHLAISIVVVDSPYFAEVGDKGTFSIANVPEGSAQLRVWAGGRWIHKQNVENTAAKEDLVVKVASDTKESDTKDPESQDGESGSGGD
jgi:hypothetical protein